jgi:hypothetical protein
MKRPEPIRDPTYNWPTGRAGEDATPAQRALAALKVGAMLAGTVTIVFIYLSSYGGFGIQRDRASLLVLAAFALPSLIAYGLGWRARRRARRDGAAGSSPAAGPGNDR